MKFVLDACAMIAYLSAEPGSEIVRELITDRSHACYAHGLNLCEVYYHFLRKFDTEKAREAVDDLTAEGVIERDDFGRAFWERVAHHKARGKISVADCVCLALAEDLGARLVTADHREFDRIAASGTCSILFIR